MILNLDERASRLVATELESCFHRSLLTERCRSRDFHTLVAITYTHMSTHMSTRMSTRMSPHMPVCTCLHTCLNAYLSVYNCQHTYPHKWLHKCLETSSCVRSPSLPAAVFGGDCFLVASLNPLESTVSKLEYHRAEIAKHIIHLLGGKLEGLRVGGPRE